MSDASVVIARPARAERLVLLFHGVGSAAANLVPLGDEVAARFPAAMVVSVGAPSPSTLGSGREWFSVAGVTEEGRPARVAQAMPLFHDAVEKWQAASGVPPERTSLVGFSQGAIMALESTQAGGAPPASRVISLAGRFAVMPQRAPHGVRFHFIHGLADGVIPAHLAREGAHRLQELGGSATFDAVPALGHDIDARVVRLMLRYLA